MIDGTSIEFEGAVFSLGYAAEALVGFLVVKVLSLVSGWNVIALGLGVFGVFVGRSVLVRFLISDVLELLVSVLMLLATLVLVMISHSQTQFHCLVTIRILRLLAPEIKNPFKSPSL